MLGPGTLYEAIQEVLADIIRAAQERLVPITMTVGTTGLALIPLIASGSIPGQAEYRKAIHG